MNRMKEITGVSGAVLWGGTLGIIVAIVLGVMLVFGFGVFQRSTADFRGGTSQIEQTRANGRFRIQAYDQFYDRCAAIQGMEATIDELAIESAAAATTDGRKAQIAATLTVVRAQRREQIAKYNADARKTGTVGQFRSIDLPGELDPQEAETTCKA